MQPATIQRILTEDYVEAADVADQLGLDKSHVCEQLRLGRFPGAFKWGRAHGGIWHIPRAAVERYRHEHLSPSRLHGKNARLKRERERGPGPAAE